MRRVKDIPDVQKALDELFAFVDKQSKAPNFHGYRLSGVGKGIDPDDAATMSQLPVLHSTGKIVYDDVRTICFGPSGTIETDDDNQFGWYRYGLEMESELSEIWIEAENPPPDDDLIMNVRYQLNEDEEPYDLIETVDDVEGLLYPQGQLYGVKTSHFITAAPKMARDSRIRPYIVQGGGASLVTLGVVVRRIIRQ